MLNIKRVLCAMDFSEFSLDALRHGVVLAKWYDAELRLVHVYEPAPTLIPVKGPPGDLPLTQPVDVDELADGLRTFCEPVLGSAGRNVELVLKEGKPAREIAREAESWPADLLVLGTHGRSGFERLFLGSVTEKVLRTTRVPLLTIPPPVHEPGSPRLKTILCAVDFSAASERALQYALSLAKEADARLIVLHVIEDSLGEAGAETLGHLSLSEYHRQVEGEALKRLRAAVPDDARVWARPDERVVKGRAYKKILDTVAGESVELVVMGVRGRSALDRLVFGSTTHRVIREAGCPVLTLHD